MLWLKRLWTWGSSLVVGVFVLGYVLTLLTHNTLNLFHDTPAPKVDRLATKVLSGMGTSQRWNMFAPNVGTLSYSPVVILVFKDGSRVALHSIVEPDLPGWQGQSLIPNDIKGEQRLYDWRFHVGDGRIRKFESNAAKTHYNWLVLRTSYTRWRASEWLARHPERKKDVRRIELWRVLIRHPGYGQQLACEGAEMMEIYPRADTRWPVPIDDSFPFYRY